MPVTLFRGQGPTLTVKAALSAATGTYGVWDTSAWNSATWGPDEIYQDISSYVRYVKTERRFARDVQAWSQGTATIVLDNRDGRFSPANMSGAYVTAGVTGVRPWRPIWIQATYAGVTYDVYKGYAKDWQESFSQALPGKGDATVTVPCVDEYGALARVDGFATAPAGAGETSGLRIHRILNAANHTGNRAVDVGNVTMQATDLSNNTVVDLELTTDSEGGGLFISRDGTVVFEDSTALIDNTRSNTVQASFADDGSALQYADVHGANDGDLLVNYAAFQRVGGTVQVATNETSRALYKDKRYTRTDLMCETDPQVLTLAQFYVIKYGNVENRFTGLHVKPRRNPSALFPAVLSREVRDLVQVTRHPPGGYTNTQLCHVAGISHEITNSNWVTDFDLWSAAIYQGVGRWDLATWDASTWFF